jgi:Family of unknown function (DUF6152)
MNTLKLLSITAVALASVSAQPASAHHSYAMFDMEKSVTLEGTVKEVQWTNPHIWIQMLVKDAATGNEVEWSIEGASPNMLTRAGWSRNALKAGDKTVIVVHPVRSGGNGLSGSLASAMVNGQRIFGGQITTPAGETK